MCVKTVINQRIVLAKLPVGEPKHSDFRIEQVELNELKQGEILLKPFTCHSILICVVA